MELRDFFVTPLVIIFVIFVAYIIRPLMTDRTTRHYFMPALAVKIIGAIALGLVYQFYYHGGDTFNYHKGSRIIFQAFTEDFSMGVKLLFSNGKFIDGGYTYIHKIPFFKDSPSFAIVRIAALFGLFTYSTYSATAVCFAVLGFTGGWALFYTFYKKYPHLHLPFALATLFVPSVVFWGSGILKDTVVLAALGFSVFTINQIFIQRKFHIGHIIGLLLSLYVIFVIRRFVLQAFIPSAILWIYYKHLTNIKSMVAKIMIAPIILLVFGVTAYYSVIKIGEGDRKYSVDKLVKTVQVTAYDIGFYTGRDAGSGYSFGKLDDSFLSMLRLAPQAVNVSLFRPYFWEIKNVFMILTALEGFLLLIMTVYILLTAKWSSLFSDADIAFCFIFSIVFAFAVGISSFNFGTLARYKIPLLPFYILALILMWHRRRVVKR